MRKSRAAVLVALLAGLSACGEEEKSGVKGELIVALQTDMELPKDVDKVRIRVASYGNTIFSNDYPVGPNELRIPATLAIFANPERPSAPATIQIIGFRTNRARVMRESVTTVPVDRIATLRMPIEWLCDESARTDNGEVVSQCPTEQTCIAGSCTSAFVDSEDLPDFEPEEIFGGGTGPGTGTCFDTAGCFSDAMRITPDLATCTAILPGTSANLNIALKPGGSVDGICNGGVCLVPLDGGKDGQWSRSDGAMFEGAPATTVQLPPGACEKLRAGKIEAIIFSNQCATKTSKAPPCGAWSSAGGGMTQIDAGNMGTGGAGGAGGAGGVGGAGGGTNDAGDGDVTMPPDAGSTDDGGSVPDSSIPDTSRPETGTTEDGGTTVDSGGTLDTMGPPDVCTGDHCAPPLDCTPPPAPTDGGVCQGIASMPPAKGTTEPSICQWDVPGGIKTPGTGFCGNLLNLQFVDLPDLPGATPIPQVPVGQCQDGPGWVFVTSLNMIELCPVSCNPVRDFGTQVRFVYGCPSMGGPMGDGGAPPPPDAPQPPPDGSVPPDVSTDGGAPPAPMVGVPGAIYNMGCVIGDVSCNNDELPNHPVSVSDYMIDETEVTQEAWDQCIKASVCVSPPCSSWNPTAMGNYPVTCVNWQEATNYCAWQGKRLPSEAEWEIAAHGSGDPLIYPWGNTEADCTVANFAMCALASPQPVRSYPDGLSTKGAFDMAGNVAEWVIDWFGIYETGGSPNPMGPPTGTMKIVRGGDYSSPATGLRSSHRVQMVSTTRNDNVGFRCAKPGLPPSR
jgi:formylglycine-generating enzyme required for sulfatase activity